jgi:hypothetical protein
MLNNKYEMVTLKSYLDELDSNKEKSLEELISTAIEKRYIAIKRAKTNAKILESLIA